MDLVTDLPGPSHPRRPRRLPVLCTGLDPFYFVTFNTYQKSPVLARQEVHLAFLDFCQKAADFRIIVGGYVVMPNHVHLLVVLPERSGQSLNAWVKALKCFLGRALTASGIEKPHWQEGFFDHVLRSNESYRNKRDYIRQNPVRAGLCSYPEDWPYHGEINAL